MKVLQVGFGDLEIFFYHFHGGVAKDDLKTVGISAVAEVVDGEGVTETVRVHIGDIGSTTEGAELFE